MLTKTFAVAAANPTAFRRVATHKARSTNRDDSGREALQLCSLENVLRARLALEETLDIWAHNSVTIAHGFHAVASGGVLATGDDRAFQQPALPGKEPQHVHSHHRVFVLFVLFVLFVCSSCLSYLNQASRFLRASVVKQSRAKSGHARNAGSDVEGCP